MAGLLEQPMELELGDWREESTFSLSVGPFAFVGGSILPFPRL